MHEQTKDRHLDVPAEANRDKHINFIAGERREVDPAQENIKGTLNDHSVKPRDEQRKNRRRLDNDQ